MNKSKKPIWEQVPGSYDLKILNPEILDYRKLRELLERINLPTPELKINFSQFATNLANKWFDSNGKEHFKQAIYCLLSNWPLSGRKAARESLRSEVIWQLWDELFCARPKERLTDWRISESKVLPDRFNSWWSRQKKCQEIE